MSKHIKKLIKRARHRLTWPVREMRGPWVHTLEIISDHELRTHTIHVPDRDVRGIEILHELGHATLCEQVNPLFSGQVFDSDDTAVLAEIAPASRAASDWFIDHWLYAHAPAEEAAEIREHLALVLRAIAANPEGTPEMLCGAALMLAQGVKYCATTHRMAGSLQQATAALLAINPARPTVANLGAAINGLLACYSQLRVAHIVDNGLDLWRIDHD